MKLFGYLTPLYRDALRLLTEAIRPVNKRIEFQFQAIHGLEGAVDVNRHRNHRHRNYQKRNGDDCGNDYQPEQWFIRVHRSEQRSLNFVPGTLSSYCRLCSVNKDQRPKYQDLVTLSFRVCMLALRPYGQRAQSYASLRHKLSCLLLPLPRSNPPEF